LGGITVCQGSHEYKRKSLLLRSSCWRSRLLAYPLLKAPALFVILARGWRAKNPDFFLPPVSGIPRARRTRARE